jgi:hypothetical protein
MPEDKILIAHQKYKQEKTKKNEFDFLVVAQKYTRKVVVKYIFNKNDIDVIENVTDDVTLKIEKKMNEKDLLLASYVAKVATNATKRENEKQKKLKEKQKNYKTDETHKIIQESKTDSKEEVFRNIHLEICNEDFKEKFIKILIEKVYSRRKERATEVYNWFHDRICQGMKFEEIAKKYNTNINRVQEIFNETGKPFKYLKKLAMQENNNIIKNLQTDK